MGVSARLVAAAGFKPVVRVGDSTQVGSIPIHSRSDLGTARPRRSERRVMICVRVWPDGWRSTRFLSVCMSGQDADTHSLVQAKYQRYAGQMR